MRRSKGDELAPNKYANECGKFKYFTQIVISLFQISYIVYKDLCQIISKIQQVDHFRVDNTLTYQQRYILSDSFAGKNASDSPIFFYTGNEGDIQWFCENTVNIYLLFGDKQSLFYELK